MTPQPEQTFAIDAEAAARVIAATRSRKFTPPDICTAALAADLEEVRRGYASFDRSALARLDAQAVAELTKFAEAVATVQEMIGKRPDAERTVCVREVLLAALEAQINLMRRQELLDGVYSNITYAEILEDALLHVCLLQKWASFSIGVNEVFKHGMQASQKVVYMAFGIWLPEIYERHFGRAFGISRSQGTLGGPGVRFVMAAAAEIGICTSNGTPYAPDIIKDARDRLRPIIG